MGHVFICRFMHTHACIKEGSQLMEMKNTDQWSAELGSRLGSWVMNFTYKRWILMGVRLEEKVTRVNLVNPSLSLAQPTWVSFIHLHLGFIFLLSKGELLLASHMLHLFFYLGHRERQTCPRMHSCQKAEPRYKM